uniref:Uncharacterized protein n=1 Tax=Ditylenchus dipsaci TaxID=166011 RepID=A0A915ENW8_9BILA
MVSSRQPSFSVLVVGLVVFTIILNLPPGDCADNDGDTPRRQSKRVLTMNQPVEGSPSKTDEPDIKRRKSLTKKEAEAFKSRATKKPEEAPMPEGATKKVQDAQAEHAQRELRRQKSRDLTFKTKPKDKEDPPAMPKSARLNQRLAEAKQQATDNPLDAHSRALMDAVAKNTKMKDNKAMEKAIRELRLKRRSVEAARNSLLSLSERHGGESSQAKAAQTHLENEEIEERKAFNEVARLSQTIK